MEQTYTLNIVKLNIEPAESMDPMLYEPIWAGPWYDQRQSCFTQPYSINLLNCLLKRKQRVQNTAVGKGVCRKIPGRWGQ